jgi:putative membrane protein
MTYKENDLILRDRLAIDRTKLANERTFLAYFRTSIIFLGTGISITQIQFFEEVVYLGWGLIILSPFILGIGIYRLIKVRRNIIRKVYQVKED